MTEREIWDKLRVTILELANYFDEDFISEEYETELTIVLKQSRELKAWERNDE